MFNQESKKMPLILLHGFASGVGASYYLYIMSENVYQYKNVNYLFELSR